MPFFTRAHRPAILLRVPSPPHRLPRAADAPTSLRWLLAVGLLGVCGWLGAQSLTSGSQVMRQAQVINDLSQALARHQDAGAQDARAEQRQHLADRETWHQAYLAREAALTQWRSTLAKRIGTDYNLAPQAADFLVQASQQAAEQQKVDPVLLLAVVGTESRFNPYLISSSGAIGLTQTMPSAHPGTIKAVSDQGGTLVDPSSNLHVGAAILAEYLTKTRGDRVAALQAYNGAGNDHQAHYAHRVLHIYDHLRAALPALPEGPSTPYPPVTLASSAAVAWTATRRD
jgi:soluble lytic murein transglycosylase-like protein